MVQGESTPVWIGRDEIEEARDGRGIRYVTHAACQFGIACRERVQRARGHRELAIELPAWWASQRLHDAEGDVGRLIVGGIRVRGVVRERANCRRARRRGSRLAVRKRGRIHAGNQSRRGKLDIAFHAADLAGKEYRRMLLHLQALRQ